MKIDKKAIAKNGLPLLAGIFSLAGMAVSHLIDTNSRTEMKSELKNEILEEILKKNN